MNNANAMASKGSDFQLRHAKLVDDMMACEQTRGQSVWEHGKAVREKMKELLDVNTNLTRDGFPGWKLPDWLIDNQNELCARAGEMPWDDYALYHDCGKPYCRTVDEFGKVHFPNHAEVSAEKYLEVHTDEEGGVDTSDFVVSELIRWDMALHVSTAEQLDALYAKWKTTWPHADKGFVATLLIAALSEIHANAALFGGIESESFKIKWKRLDRRGSQLCKLMGL